MRISKRWSLGLLGFLAVLPIAGLAQPDSSVPAEAPAPAVVPEQVHFSPGIKDILKLLDAKVDPSVINSYIKSSNTAYNPTATEIIALKNHGVSDDIIMAVLQRGSEVRSQLARSAQAVPLTAPNGVQPPYAPDSMQSAPDSYPVADYGYSYPYSYPYYSYSYPYYGYGGGGYPYWWWNTWYPWVGWPYFYGSFAHNHFHGNNFVNHSHSFHGSFAAHGGFAHAGFGNAGMAHGGFAHAGFGGGAMHGGGGFSGGHGGGMGGMHGGGMGGMHGGGMGGMHGGGMGGGGHGGGGHR